MKNLHDKILASISNEAPNTPKGSMDLCIPRFFSISQEVQVGQIYVP